MSIYEFWDEHQVRKVGHALFNMFLGSKCSTSNLTKRMKGKSTNFNPILLIVEHHTVLKNVNM
jgi:hypothetical protein